MTLTADQFSQALLGRGYFPKELPPPFQTQKLADKLLNVRATWTTLRGAMSSSARKKHPESTHSVLFDMARKGHARRTLAIPNVVNQFYLVEELAKYWDQITSVIDQSSLSITKCSVTSEGRAVYVPPLSILAEKRVILQAAQGAILHTDVLSFYHSIYTHAIPWALHGKAVTKSNRNPNDPAVFGNRIDSLVRSCQDGQTIGIPVGPDTSRILSELMLSAVEAHIPRKIFNRITAGFRYMDDFFLYFGTISDAETVLAGLREACLHFDLQLNAAKTITGSALAYNEDSWPSELSAIPIARSGKQQRRSLMRFFLAAIRLAKDLPDESIANFAVRRTSKIHVDKENWDLYQAFIIRMAIENSNCIDSVVKVLCTYAAVGYEVDSTSMSRFIDKIIADHAPYNHHFEVAWALWLARSLDVRLSPAASSFVMRIENDVCAILALHLRGRHLLSSGTRALSWISSVAAEDLYGDHWLLIYEAALHKGWPITGASAAVSANKFFDSLKAEGISFYNTRAYNRPLNIPRIETELLSALSGRKRAMLPGAILGVSGPREERLFERLGGEYGEDDEDDPFSSYSTLDDNEDEGPF